MDEAEILAHLFLRDERGLQAAQERYGARLKGLAQRIAGAETAEECVNDALLAAWNAIPPLRPRSLYAYLCRLTRSLPRSGGRMRSHGRVSPPWKTAVSFPRR